MHERIPRALLAMVMGRGVANLGASFIGFAVDVWVYRQTGSYAVFALLALLGTLPSLVLAPFAGVIADRWNRRSLLIACDGASLLILSAAAALHACAALTIPAVSAVLAAMSIAASLRWTVLGAYVGASVPQGQLGRVNAILQTFDGMNVFLAPLIGAVALDVLGLQTLLSAAASAYLCGLGGLLWSRSDTPQSIAEKRFKFRGFVDELTFGFRWVLAHRGLRRFLMFFTVINLGVAVHTVSSTPFVLSVASSSWLALCVAAEGVAAMLTGMWLARAGASGNYLLHVLRGAMALGLCILAWGLTRHPWALVVESVVLGAMTTSIMVSSQTVWQLEVPSEIQGKVFAVRRMVALSLTPVAILASIPLSTAFFQPLLLNSMAMRSAWGEGPAAPLGLMVSVCGAFIALGTCALRVAGGIRGTAEGPSAQASGWTQGERP